VMAEMVGKVDGFGNGCSSDFGFLPNQNEGGSSIRNYKCWHLDLHRAAAAAGFLCSYPSPMVGLAS
ncbi:hypothetical protein PIB30_088079, partial [Stylosanthes scabra]|nr:hypothetical protein [Stylosanthes scabra]